jgi:DNA-directed RNA polymerase subunit RPC12/RpoP
MEIQEPHIIQCPNCGQFIEILELNCRIFRCGVLKHNNEQINAHLNEKECTKLKKNDLIYGCGKPFQILENNTVIICEYI